MNRRADGRYRMSRMIGGNRVYFYSTEENEKKRQKDFETQLREYQVKEAKGKLFSKVADAWQDEHDKTVSYATARRYAPLVDYAEDFFDGVYIRDIEPEDVDAYMQTYIGNPLRGSKKTATMALSVLNMIFIWAIRHRECKTNPCTYITLPKNMPKKQRTLPSDSDIRKVGQHSDSDMGMFAYLLIYTGLRRAEAMALTWKDIDFKAKRIYVTKSCYKDYSKGQTVVKSTKTEAGMREVVLVRCLADKLRAYKKKSKSIYVFSDDNGNMLTDSKIEKMWKKYQKEAGISFTPHQARHLYATLLNEADVDEKTAQALMGHASIQTTKNIYTHVRQKSLDKTAEKLERYIDLESAKA